MTPFNIILTLLGLAVVTFASAIPRDDAITSNDNVGMMCVEGDRKCLAANDDGKDGGVFECVGGYWKMIQDCRSFECCVSTPTPHCTWAQLRRDDTENPSTDASVAACREGELKCLAANDDAEDGGVFQCVNGYWKMFQDCRSFERCVSKPTPHCTWAKAGLNLD
jgi:uncharacterized cupin superfamily protein